MDVAWATRDTGVLDVLFLWSDLAPLPPRQVPLGQPMNTPVGAQEVEQNGVKTILAKCLFEFEEGLKEVFLFCYKDEGRRS